MDLKAYLSGGHGSQSALARKVGCPSQLMWQWQAGVRQVPAERCPTIERATSAAVTCEELRADVRWHRVPDPGWPHPQGRPLIDPAPLCEPAQEVRDAA